jgi:hypothetical protein
MLKYDDTRLDYYERALLGEVMSAIHDARAAVSRAGNHVDWFCPELQQINGLANGCAQRIQQNYSLAEDLCASVRSVKAVFNDTMKVREAAFEAFPGTVDSRGILKTAVNFEDIYMKEIKIPPVYAWLGNILSKLGGGSK